MNVASKQASEDRVSHRRPKRPKRPEPSPGIRSPRSQDVLCGRGGKSNQWPGNLIYRQVVLRNKYHYQSAEEPQHKGFIVVSIIEAIHRQCPPGRFLRFHKGTNMWHEISRKEAFGKTSQALRELEGRKTDQVVVPVPQVQQPTAAPPPPPAPTLAAAAVVVPPEPVESQTEVVNLVDANASTARKAKSEPSSVDAVVVDLTLRDAKRPLYGVPSQVPLEDDDDDDELDDLDSVVYDLDREFDFSQDSRLDKTSVAGMRPLQIHIGIPFTPCRNRFVYDLDDQTAIVSTSGHQSRSSGSEFDEESELGDEAYGIPTLPGCQMRAPSMTELLQREDSLAFENAIFQI